MTEEITEAVAPDAAAEAYDALLTAQDAASANPLLNAPYNGGIIYTAKSVGSATLVVTTASNGEWIPVE